MNVNQLIAELSKLDPELPVLCCTEDEDLLPRNHSLRLLEIDGVEVWEAERCRGEDQVPGLKLGKGPCSEGIAIIRVTSDF